mmetsp:Transcript_50627/g.151369  ORF Transcript_50627/g.151369 Transcript_50627/m.151369 type:complete len:200 (+) Transcript_50627:1064-1663(+)
MASVGTRSRRETKCRFCAPVSIMMSAETSPRPPTAPVMRYEALGSMLVLLWMPWYVFDTSRDVLGASRATWTACWLKMWPWSDVDQTGRKLQAVNRFCHSGVSMRGYVTRRSQSVSIHHPSVKPKVKSSPMVPPFCTSLKMMCPPGPSSVWQVAMVDAKWMVAWITLVAKIWCISWLLKPWSAGCLSPLKMVNSTKGNC